MNTADKSVLIPHLWFDTEAVEAVEFYCPVFPDSEITSRTVIRDTPSGDCDCLSFSLWGGRFEAIGAGPEFKFNPSISFMVDFGPEDAAWEKLSEGGRPLMELGEYEFSRGFGWIQDRYGLSWQLLLADPDGVSRPSILTSRLFVGDNCEKAEESGAFYRKVFPDSAKGIIARYPAGPEPETEGNIMFSDFRLGSAWFTAADSAHDHRFQFNESVSFIVRCGNQAEIDDFWEKLSAVPEAEQCGWLKDRYGMSWQIVPAALNDLLEKGGEKQRPAVTTAFLQMKKFDIEKLNRGFEESRGTAAPGPAGGSTGSTCRFRHSSNGSFGAGNRQTRNRDEASHIRLRNRLMSASITR